MTSALLDPVAPVTGLHGPRVTLDARFIGFAGIGRMIDGLWRGLVEIGADVVGLWPADASRDWMGEHHPGPAGPRIAVRGRPFVPVEQVVLPIVVQRTGAAVHHATNFSVPHLAGVPVVMTVHDLFPYLDPGVARSRVTASVYRAIVPPAIRRSRMIVAVSSFAREPVLDTFDVAEDRIRVIEHGIDHERWYRRDEAEVAAALAAYRLPEEFLLYVGTVKPHKNLATVLTALGPHHPPLVLAGPDRADLEQAQLTLPPGAEVIALGRVSDEALAALYTRARALLLPSLYESVGFTALEAMACGTPVVSSDGGGLPSTVGDAGLLVAPRDVAGWSEAMTTISEQDAVRDRLVAAAYDHVRGRSWHRAAEQYLDVYREVVA